MIKQRLLSFLNKYWVFAAIVLGVGVLFTFTEHFSQIEYGILRFGILHLLAFGARDVIFRHSFRPYIHDPITLDGIEYSSAFVADFTRASGVVKVSWVLGLLALYLVVGAICFVL